MSRRAQTALEYVGTYGWVFLVVITTIGAMSYTGVIKTDPWVPESCVFDSPIGKCADIQGLSDGVRVRLINHATRALILSDSTATVGSCTVASDSIYVDGRSLNGSSQQWSVGEPKEFMIDTKQCVLNSRAKDKVALSLTYAGAGDSFSKTITGTMFVDCCTQTSNSLSVASVLSSDYNTTRTNGNSSNISNPHVTPSCADPYMNISTNGSRISFSWASQAGCSYQLSGKTSLTDPPVIITGTILGTGETIVISQNLADIGSYAFFQVGLIQNQSVPGVGPVVGPYIPFTPPVGPPTEIGRNDSGVVVPGGDRGYSGA